MGIGKKLRNSHKVTRRGNTFKKIIRDKKKYFVRIRPVIRENSKTIVGKWTDTRECIRK